MRPPFVFTPMMLLRSKKCTNKVEIMSNLKPSEIVKELDKYIIGQDKAKKMVAIALRNRWRRQQVSSDLKEEIMPNNIILIGATGVGKTEISRRLARLAGAPFTKIEASKFTITGLFPPSSSVTGVRCREAPSIIIFPIPVPPVKKI